MGFQEDIQEIEKYLSIWMKVDSLNKLNTKVLIDHKINLLAEHIQGQSITLTDSIVEVAKLKDLIMKSQFAPGSVEALIFKMMQDSMLRNGLEVVQEFELDFYGKISRLYEVVSVEVDGVMVVPETEAKKYLVFHYHRPFSCDLVREQNAYEYLHGVQDLDKSPPWSGFSFVPVQYVDWYMYDSKVKVTLNSSGKKKVLLLQFRDVNEAKCWVSSFKKISEEFESHHPEK